MAEKPKTDEGVGTVWHMVYITIIAMLLIFPRFDLLFGTTPEKKETNISENNEKTAHKLYIEQGSGLTAIRAPASQTCGVYVSHLKDDKRNDFPLAETVYKGWVLGFVTASEFFLNDNFPIENQSLSAWFEKYCHDHPLETLHEAAKQLVFELKNKTKMQL